MKLNVLLGALAVLAASVLASPAVLSDEPKILVVVNAANNASVDAPMLRNIYLGTATYWDNGTKIVPVQRPEESDAGKAFFSGVLKMAPSRYRHQWQTQELSGQGVAPESLDSAAQVVARVAARPGAVGYILESEKAAANGAKVRLLPID